ncbi:MAG: hypothetical protein R3C28_04200 [Pirellulaceae bacterium]
MNPEQLDLQGVRLEISDLVARHVQFVKIWRLQTLQPGEQVVVPR